MKNESSDDDQVDAANYKGIYYGQEEEKKSHDPVTGAHFTVPDL